MLYRANVAALLFCIVCVGLAKPVRGHGQIASRAHGKHVASSSRRACLYQGGLVHGPVSREPYRRLVLHAAVFSRSSADSFFPTRRSLLEEEVGDHCFSATPTLR